VFALSGAELMRGNTAQLANFFAGDVNNRGGLRVAVKDLDNDRRADLVASSGQGAGSQVTAYLGKDVPTDGAPPAAQSFESFAGFRGGVYVG
jgi:hypothetical protein